MSNIESTTGVVLPTDNIITTEWAKEQLQRVDVFSQELLNYGRGEIFFMLQTNLSAGGFEQSISDLGYTVETANTYISYLQKKVILEAIKDKYYTALSLSAAEFIPDSIDEALAICDVCVAKYGKLTAANLQKALEDTGKSVKKMSDAAISIEALKKKSLHDWLLDEHQLSDDDILQASRIATEGRSEYLEKMLQAYHLLGDWKEFYEIIAEPIKASENPKALRFLSDMQDASDSIMEYLASETAYHNLSTLKETFENEVYPKLSMEAHTMIINCHVCDSDFESIGEGEVTCPYCLTTWVQHLYGSSATSPMTNDAGEKLQSTDETLKQRGNRYGEFSTHSDISQIMKIEFINHVKQYGQPENFTNSMNESIEMIIHKIARIANGDPTYDDNWRDIAGYAELIVKELNSETTTSPKKPCENLLDVLLELKEDWDDILRDRGLKHYIPVLLIKSTPNPRFKSEFSCTDDDNNVVLRDLDVTVPLDIFKGY